MAVDDTDVLLRTISVDVGVIRAQTEELARHQAVANGRLNKMEETQQIQTVLSAKLEGAASLGRWVIATLLAVMTVGTAVAGVILGIVLKGH